MALDLFIGICGALCLIVGGSILLGKLVMWIQEKLRLRREEKELGRIVQQQKRWENLEKELEALATDPKPWQPPVRWDRNAVQTDTPAPGSNDLIEN